LVFLFLFSELIYQIRLVDFKLVDFPNIECAYSLKLLAWAGITLLLFFLYDEIVVLGPS
jgi:hypothetical protein